MFLIRYAPSQLLHPSFHELSTNYFRHRVKYKQEDGSLRSRSLKSRDANPIHVERLGFIYATEETCWLGSAAPGLLIKHAVGAVAYP